MARAVCALAMFYFSYVPEMSPKQSQLRHKSDAVSYFEQNIQDRGVTYAVLLDIQYILQRKGTASIPKLPPVSSAPLDVLLVLPSLVSVSSSRVAVSSSCVAVPSFSAAVSSPSAVCVVSNVIETMRAFEA